MVHRAGMAPREKDAWPQTSALLFQQKTEDIEQVIEVMSQEKDIDFEKFGSIRERRGPLQSKIKRKK